MNAAIRRQARTILAILGLTFAFGVCRARADELDDALGELRKALAGLSGKGSEIVRRQLISSQVSKARDLLSRANSSPGHKGKLDLAITCTENACKYLKETQGLSRWVGPNIKAAINYATEDAKH